MNLQNKKPIERVFLDWKKPLLEITADYLIKKFASGSVDSDVETTDNSALKCRLDLSSVVLVFPVHRAIKRFEEILTVKVNLLANNNQIDPAWIPPEIITLGSLPEKFYEQNFPIANEITQFFAWRHAILNLQNANSESLQNLLPSALDKLDVVNGIALGKIFAELHYELVSENIDFKRIIEKYKTLNLQQEIKRWEALNSLKNEYHKILDNLEIWDLQSAREFAVKEHDDLELKKQAEEEYKKICSEFEEQNKQFILVGLVDMNTLQKEIVNKFSQFVTALIFAPSDYKNSFDESGCIVPEKWLNEVIPIDDSQIEIVERSDFEADAVLRCLNDSRNLESSDGKFAAGEISIIAANGETLPFFKRRFREANIKLSHFKGTELKHTPIFRFLDLLAKFIATKKFSDLAELARHPDMYDFLKQKFIDNQNYHKLLSALDQYCNKFIPDKIDGNWKSISESDYKNSQQDLDDAIQKTWTIVCDLIDGLEISDPTNINHRRELPNFWLDKIDAILAQFYYCKDRQITRETLEFIAIANRKINKIPQSIVPPMTFFETINLQLSLLNTEFIPPYPDVDAIDLIGWLDATMDDSALLVVSGMNDGFIPSYVIADSFLPDNIRVELNILDNKRRCARDAYALIVTIKTRKNNGGCVHLISSRSSIAGDPLIPSRLLFATDDNNSDERLKLVKRVQRFFGEMPKQPKIILEGSVESNLSRSSKFCVPKLPELKQPIQKMRVTEFADYVRCPYRYFLKQRLELFPIDDSAEEISPSGFGNLIHAVLCEFGRDELTRNFDDEEIIKLWLKDKLLEVARKIFGESPRAAIAIQIERAASRLEAFAKWQADRRKSGHKILHVEFKLDAKECEEQNYLEVDNRKMILTGRIDRIDYDEKNKVFTIIDYKTSDKVKMPKDVYKEIDGQWLDFQLPLYKYILQNIDKFKNAPIALAYVNLPKTNKVEIKVANWSEEVLNEAIEQAKKIVHDIWENNFDLTNPPPLYSADYAPICLDNIPK
ncbi:MAG: PD-(D/E)XK nuclease family protein [Planctomycetaceae bacterium]|jgi:hypothetical protein|nr:PD-(D/E)XK nuclease family protein [Planctomycetaceae bacterium]